MRSPYHFPLDDLDRLYQGYERVAIEAALTDERLQQRGRAWRALVDHLPRLSRTPADAVPRPRAAAH